MKTKTFPRKMYFSPSNRLDLTCIKPVQYFGQYTQLQLYRITSSIQNPQTPGFKGCRFEARTQAYIIAIIKTLGLTVNESETLEYQNDISKF